jgi:hypothetical protein
VLGGTVEAGASDAEGADEESVEVLPQALTTEARTTTASNRREITPQSFQARASA